MPRVIKKLLICAVYHPPQANNSSLTDHICYCIDDIKRKFCNTALIISGDLNPYKESVISCMYNLRQIVKSATRNKAIIDKTLTDIPDWYQIPDCSVHIGKSDHKCVIMQPKMSPQLH